MEQKEPWRRSRPGQGAGGGGGFDKLGPISSEEKGRITGLEKRVWSRREEWGVGQRGVGVGGAVEEKGEHGWTVDTLNDAVVEDLKVEVRRSQLKG